MKRTKDYYMELVQIPQTQIENEEQIINDSYFAIHGGERPGQESIFS